MLKALTSGAISVGLLLATPATIAQMSHESSESSGNFQTVDQPIGIKLAVTAGGLGLMGLELWWFLFSKPKSQQASSRSGIQEITIAVDGGYNPSRVIVNVGQTVRLKFDRRDPSSCLEEVRLPDFHIAKALPLNQTTVIEFTPDRVGSHEFTCGMNMYRGIIEVQAAKSNKNTIDPAIAHPIASS